MNARSLEITRPVPGLTAASPAYELYAPRACRIRAMLLASLAVCNALLAVALKRN